MRKEPPFNNSNGIMNISKSIFFLENNSPTSTRTKPVRYWDMRDDKIKKWVEFLWSNAHKTKNVLSSSREKSDNQQEAESYHGRVRHRVCEQSMDQSTGF